MKTHFTTLALSLLLLTSCQSEEEKLIAQMEPILRNVVLSDSLAVKIDSLVIYKVDTLTAAKYSLSQAEMMSRKIEFHKTMADIYNSRSKLSSDLARSNKRMASMYKSTLNDSELAKYKNEDALKDYDEAIAHLNTSKLHLDSVLFYSSRINEIADNIKSGKIDSVKLTGYIPRFRLIGANKSGVEIREDSMYTFISPNMNVIQVKLK